MLTVISQINILEWSSEKMPKSRLIITTIRWSGNGWYIDGISLRNSFSLRWRDVYWSEEDPAGRFTFYISTCILYFIILYCIVLYCIVLYRIVSCRVVSCRVVSCCVVLCCVVLCCVVLCCVVLCCVVLCCLIYLPYSNCIYCLARKNKHY